MHKSFKQNRFNLSSSVDLTEYIQEVSLSSRKQKEILDKFEASCQSTENLQEEKYAALITESQLSSEQLEKLKNSLAIKRESTRNIIVGSFLSFFAFTLVASALLTGAALKSDSADSQLIKDWTSTMVAVQSGFIGGTIGFYFGIKSKSKDS